MAAGGLGDARVGGPAGVAAAVGSLTGKSTGKLTSAAFSGALRGTLMTEIPSCGGWQSGNVALGEYDETYT